MKTYQNNFWDFFLKHYRVTYILIVLVVIFGVFSIWQIPKESSPEVDVPIATVTTFLPGANSLEVENLVTNPIEKQIANMEDLDTYTSSSRAGVSQVIVQFDINSDGDEQVSKLRDRLANIGADLPSDAELPVIEKIRFTDQPIVVMTLSGQYSAEELIFYADTIESELEKIPFVSRVETIGAPQKELRVEIEKNRLDQYGLSVNEIVRAIQIANNNIPIGSIETAGEVFYLRLAGGLKTLADLKQVPIKSSDGVPIVVNDLGQVLEAYNTGGSLSRLSILGGDPEPAVTLSVYKTAGGDIIDIVGAVQSKIENLKEKTLPTDIDIAYIENWATLIKADLFNLIFSGLGTVAIILILLIVFLGLREALLASLVVPLTFFITFIFLGYLNYTINFLTLFSLILALGILVDASIVVVESLYQKLGAGQSSSQAAHNTTAEFSLPLMSGTLTTILIFLPMLLTSGIIGKFIVSIPVTITIVLLASLFVALGVLTTIGARFLRFKVKPDYSSEKYLVKKIEYYIKFMVFKYDKLLDTILLDRAKQNRMFKWLGVAFIIAIMLPVTGLVAINMFPASNYDTFYIDLTKPIGTTLADTNQSVVTLENILLQDDRLDTFLVRVGGGNNSHQANFTIKVDPTSSDKSLSLIDEYNNKLENILPSEVVVRGLEDGPPQGSPITINISGESIESVEAVAQNYIQILRTIPEAQNVRLSSPESNGEFVLEIDKIRAGIYGVSAVDVASLLRTVTTGTTATVIKDGQTDTDVVVSYSNVNNGSNLGVAPEISLATIEGLTINTPFGSVPLSTFAIINLTNSRSVIEHEDGQRQIKVLADVKKGVTPGEVLADFNEARKNLELSPTVSVNFGGEQEDIAESFADMGKAMILGMFLIYALLVWQFQSFKQPFYIMTSIPLSLIGVMVGLFVVRLPLSFPGFIGVVALAGIVVNNAIILIDRINNDRQKGLSKIEAVKESTKTRLRPIMLTTITTVLGILPLALSSETWGPLAYSIVFGLSFSTILTLFLIPILYNRFEK